ncbi:hypothetical protein P7H22_20045 [Paenibacillus larvae]|nr:hypothetical protein [Paenibacillus larvae]MDT2242165.1 hypothetical protein [Paenibacillus larvae]
MIIVALSLLVHTTTVLSKHQEIIKILVQENAYMNKEIKDLASWRRTTGTTSISTNRKI